MKRFGRLAIGLLPVMLGGAASPRLPLVPPPLSSAALAPRAPLLAIEGIARQGGILYGRTDPDAALMLNGRAVPVAPDGRFLIGFGRDAPVAAQLVATAAGGGVTARTIAVAPRAWDIQSLPTLARGTTPTPEFLARRKIELDQIDAARLAGSNSQGWRQHFIWPATGRISGVFGSQRIYAGEPGAYHGGVDVAKPTGAVVVAPADGVVVLAAAAPFTLEGNLLMIDHGMGLNSAFLHLSRIDVAVGDHVRQGQAIGRVGATGRATGPHLHWGMKWQDERIDPAGLAEAMPVGVPNIP